MQTLKRLAVSFLFSILVFSLGMIPVRAEKQSVWIGTGATGIYHLEFDDETGKLSDPTLAAEIRGPGFLTATDDGKRLYSVGNVDDESSVASFDIGKGGKLEFINAQPIGDGGAAHLSLDRRGRALLTAQYGAGSVAAFPIDAKGAIEPRSALIKHDGGSKIDGRRQTRPHPHWAGTSPDNQFAFIPDLGLDQVVVYRLTENPVGLEPHTTGQVPAGAGPRHMKFHPNGKFIYVLNELALSLSVFAYDAATGKMSLLATVPTLDDATKAGEAFNAASEIRVHPSGKFLYTANRGHDTISVFSVSPDGSTVKRVEVEPIRGAWPRNFNLDLTGRWLLAAGSHSNTVAVFRVDEETGKLMYDRQIVNVPSPMCVLFTRDAN